MKSSKYIKILRMVIWLVLNLCYAFSNFLQRTYIYFLIRKTCFWKETKKEKRKNTTLIGSTEFFRYTLMSQI